MQITDKKVLVTGGASGIGFGLSEQFVKDGNTVIVCGRRDSVLKEAKNKIPSLITFVCDLEKETERKKLFEWISKEHSDLNILVNNAGIQNWKTPAEEGFYEGAKKEIAINIEAPVHLCSLFATLPSLQIIMNVTSGLAFSPLTKVPVYCATKSFFRSFTVSLRHLLKSKNISVIEIIPPALNTDLGGKGLHDFAPPVSGFIESVFSQLEKGSTEITYGLSEKYD